MTRLTDILPGFKDMKLNPFTLAFNNEIEGEFLSDYHKKSINQVRISFFLALLLYALYGILDMHIKSDIRYLFWLIRFSVMIPIGLLIFVASFSQNFYKFRDISLAFCMILYGFSLMVMLYLSPKPFDFAYYATLIITFIFIYIFISIRFIPAIITSAIILVMYEFTAIWFLHTPIEMLIKYNFFFISANVIGMFAAYSIEFYARRDFFIAHLIEDNRLELDYLNKDLEKRVEEKTLQLEVTNKGLKNEIAFRKKAEDQLRGMNVKLQKLLNDTVSGLIYAVEMRDPYTAGHQKRVGQLVSAIAKEMELSDDTQDCLKIASIIHDIGKIVVPVEILTKPYGLNKFEITLLQNHPKSGYDILKTIDFPWPIADIILQHHERLDGSGYPNGLKDDEIHLEAKILAVADVVEAMASNRPYRPSKGIDQALAELEKNKGILYDTQIAETCIKLFREKNFTFK